MTYTRLMLAVAIMIAGAVTGDYTTAAEKSSAVAIHVDGEWFRRTLVEDTSRWLAAAGTPRGFFNANIDRQWRPKGTQSATAVSQSRMLYVLSTGYDVTRDQRFVRAIQSGADFLLAHFRDTSNHDWYWRVGADGQVLERRHVRYRFYGPAFVVFGLSHAYRVTGDKRFLDAALDTRAHVFKELLDAILGHGEPRSMGVDDTSKSHTFNALLHVFEASLALYEVTRSRDVWSDIEKLADAIFGRYFRVDEGYVAEFFDAQWNPIQTDRVSHGHQIEMAFLVSRAVEYGLPQRYLTFGERLVDSVMMNGYDGTEGGLFTASDRGGAVTDSRKGWWQQCELLRTLMHYAARRGRRDLWPMFDRSLALVKDRFIDAEYGGWYRTPRAPGDFDGDDTAKGSDWKVGYHVAMMYSEALRLRAERD